MMPKLHYKLKQFAIAVIKVATLILAGYVIYIRLLKNNALSWDTFLLTLHTSEILALQTLLLLVTLTAINWLLEIKKWQLLAAKVGRLSFFEATKQALASQTTTLITPMRAGEYGVKALFVTPEKRKAILSLNLFGNLMQLAVTIILGIIGSLYLVERLWLQWFWWHLLGIAMLSLLVVVFYILHKIEKRAFFKTLVNIRPVFKWGIFLLAFARYLVFAHQFYILTLLFGMTLPYPITMAIITTTYLLSSMIPVLSFFDIVLKGGVALFLFGFFAVEALPILCITTLMWILNIVLPSVVGGGFLLTSKFSSDFKFKEHKLGNV